MQSSQKSAISDLRRQLTNVSATEVIHQSTIQKLNDQVRRFDSRLSKRDEHFLSSLPLQLASQTAKLKWYVENQDRLATAEEARQAHVRDTVVHVRLEGELADRDARIAGSSGLFFSSFTSSWLCFSVLVVSVRAARARAQRHTAAATSQQLGRAHYGHQNQDQGRTGRTHARGRGA